MPKKLLLLGLSLVLFTTLRGQNKQYQFSNLDISNGLSHNQVTAVYKDTKGFMWFGTSAGLNRYDGFKFKVFKHDAKDTTSINDDFITQILEGPEGKLWVRTRFGSVFTTL